MSKSIRWGILGTALIAREKMVDSMKASGNGQPYAVASRSPEKAKAFADEMGIEKSCGSYEDLLADPDVDAVYLPLPTGLHPEWAIRCAQAGKPTLCEKPLAANAAEARRMADAFSEANVLLAEGLMYRFHPMTRKVKELIEAGRIGAVRLIRSSFPADLFDTNDFRFSQEMGGGALLDLGVYCVSMTRLLAGQEPDRVAALANFGTTTGVDEQFVGLLGFPGGVLGYFGCAMKAHFDCSYDIIGEKGRLRVDFGGMVAWPGADFHIQCWLDGEESTITIPSADHYKLMLEDFADAVANQRETTYPIDESIRNIETLDRLMASARSSGAH